MDSRSSDTAMLLLLLENFTIKIRINMRHLILFEHSCCSAPEYNKCVNKNIHLQHELRTLNIPRNIRALIVIPVFYIWGWLKSDSYRPGPP